MNQKIMNIATATETAKNVFTAFGERQRFRQETDLRALKASLLKDGKKVVDDEFNALFKKLQDSGVGSIIVGRGGKSNRFKWHYNLRELTSAVNKTEQQPKEQPKSEALPAGEQPIFLVIPSIGLSKQDIEELIKLTTAKKVVEL